jgi:hypothetical protein
MTLLARALARLVSFVLLIVLAAAGLAIAVFSIDTGRHGPSLARLAADLHLYVARHAVGHWLGRLESGSAVALVAALCGLAAILLGLLLLTGLLAPQRERLITLSSSESGTLAARPRPLAAVAQALAEQARGVTVAKAAVRRYRRRDGARLRLRVSHPTKPAESVDAVRESVLGEVRELTDAFALTPRVEVARRGPRVQ